MNVLMDQTYDILIIRNSHYAIIINMHECIIC